MKSIRLLFRQSKPRYLNIHSNSPLRSMVSLADMPIQISHRGTLTRSIIQVIEGHRLVSSLAPLRIHSSKVDSLVLARVRALALVQVQELSTSILPDLILTINPKAGHTTTHQAHSYLQWNRWECPGQCRLELTLADTDSLITTISTDGHRVKT